MSKFISHWGSSVSCNLYQKQQIVLTNESGLVASGWCGCNMLDQHQPGPAQTGRARRQGGWWPDRLYNCDQDHGPGDQDHPPRLYNCLGTHIAVNCISVLEQLSSEVMMRVCADLLLHTATDEIKTICRKILVDPFIMIWDKFKTYHYTNIPGLEIRKDETDYTGQSLTSGWDRPEWHKPHWTQINL